MDIAFDSQTGEPLGWTIEARVLHCRVRVSPAAAPGLVWFVTLEECTRGAAECEPSVAPLATPVGAAGTAVAIPVLCASGSMAARAEPPTVHALLGCVRPDGTARACETATFVLTARCGVLLEPLVVRTGERLELEVVRIEPLAPPCMAHTLALAARAGWDAEVLPPSLAAPTGLGLRRSAADGEDPSCAWYHLDDLARVPPLDLVPSDAARKQVAEAAHLLEGVAARPALPLGDLAQRLSHVAVQAAGLLGTPDVRVHLHRDQVVCPPRRLCVPLGGGRRATPVVSVATARASVARRLADLAPHTVVLERAEPDATQCLVFRYAHAAQQDSLLGLPVACVVMHVSPDDGPRQSPPRADVLAPTGVSASLDALLAQQSQRAAVHTVLVVNDA